jgi:hypothetical protein
MTMSETYQADADVIQGGRSIRRNPALLAAFMAPRPPTEDCVWHTLSWWSNITSGGRWVC